MGRALLGFSIQQQLLRLHQLRLWVRVERWAWSDGIVETLSVVVKEIKIEACQNQDGSLDLDLDLRSAKAKAASRLGLIASDRSRSLGRDRTTSTT